MEVFEQINGYEGYYSVSNIGNVRSERSGIVLRPATDKHGYLYYVFCVNGKRKTVKAHRLVASTFIPNPENKPTVDHINCDKKDNRVENLRWATNKEQTNNPITYQRISIQNSREKLQKMGEVRNFGRKAVKVFDGGTMIGVFPSLLAAAQKTKTNYSKASEAANGKRKTANGYIFRYVKGVPYGRD